MERDALITLLGELVSIDSVNPSLSPTHRGEWELGDFLVDRLRSLGFDTKRQEVEEGRFNVIGRSGRGKTLLIVAHMDTVGVDSMTIPPFKPSVIGDRLYGRGSADTKGGMAAALMAIETVLLEDDLRGELVFAATVDEEYEAKGAEALMREIDAEGALVMEPVGLRPVIAHKGFAWQEFQVFGRAAHGSDPAKGIDAIMRTGRLLEKLKALDRSLMRRSHPLLGSPSLHASQIEGGEGWSVYPSICGLRVERRTLPAETREMVDAEFNQIVDELQEEGIVSRTEMRFFREGTEVDEGEEIVRSLMRAMVAEGMDCSLAGMGAWPEAGILNRSGIPSVVFGPSGCRGHEADEYVDIDSVRRCARVLRLAIRDFLH